MHCVRVCTQLTKPYMAETSCNPLLFIDSATYVCMYIPNNSLYYVCTIKLLPCRHCCAQAISIGCAGSVQ